MSQDQNDEGGAESAAGRSPEILGGGESAAGRGPEIWGGCECQWGGVGEGRESCEMGSETGIPQLPRGWEWAREAEADP